MADFTEFSISNITPVRKDFRKDFTAGAVYTDAQRLATSSIANLNTALLASAGGFTAAKLAVMTDNDKLFAYRVLNNLN